MRPKLLIVLFGVAAFFCASFGATAVAKAAQPDEMVAITPVLGSVSSAHVRANLASPGSYAAKFGAPLCDDRAASAYAAEPKPAPVDGGEVAAGVDDTAGTTAGCQTSVGALFKATSDASPTQSDDLQRVPPVARDLAILPTSIDVPPVVELVALLSHEVSEGAREGYEPRDNPPPRPIPWRS